MSALSQAEAFARIRLLRSPRIGPVSFAQLLARYGSGEEAVEALPGIAKKGGGHYTLAKQDSVRSEIDAVKCHGARYLFHDQPDYPQALAACDGAPPIITYKGDLSLASKPVVAMVGARNASAAAVKLARDFASALSAEGFVVVSGLARGIDGAAHEGAMPHTIGVIASGIEIAYPPQHAELQERIASEGLLIAEQPPGTEPRGSHFPSRNRIIAGLALGTLVVEAAVKSGSLITARLAGEYGREVMAIPGSPLDARSHGCNHLIREGAVLVQEPSDVVELLSTFDGAPRSTFREPSAAFEAVPEDMAEAEPAEIAQLLTSAPVSVDELIRQSGAGSASVQLALLELEIAGRLERHAGGKVSLS
ncbi:DNA-processing protein DprA [Citromicrobium bathyomarinum]